MKQISIFCILLIPYYALGLQCEDWIRHLQLDHNVWLVEKTNAINSAFNYQTIKGSSLMVATKKNETSWKVESKNSGKWISMRNEYFGYIIEYNSNGKCLNTSGTSYMGYEDKNVGFNYDWKICEQVNDLLGKKLTKLDDLSISKAVKALAPKDQKIMKLQAAKANTSPFKPSQNINENKVIDLCLGQIRFVEETLRQPLTKPPVTPTVR